MHGDVSEATCGHTNAGVPRAYNSASRQGTIDVNDCAWPPKYMERDGVCVARFLYGDKRERRLLQYL